MESRFEDLAPEKLCLFLQQEIPTLSEEIFAKIVEHKIDGEVFLSLNDEYLREIAPLLGDRLKLRRVLAATLAEASVSFTVRILYIVRLFFPITYICWHMHMHTQAFVKQNSLSSHYHFNALISLYSKWEWYSNHCFQELCFLQPCPCKGSNTLVSVLCPLSLSLSAGCFLAHIYLNVWLIQWWWNRTYAYRKRCQ